MNFGFRKYNMKYSTKFNKPLKRFHYSQDNESQRTKLFTFFKIICLSTDKNLVSITITTVWKSPSKKIRQNPLLITSQQVIKWNMEGEQKPRCWWGEWEFAVTENNLFCVLWEILAFHPPTHCHIAVLSDSEGLVVTAEEGFAEGWGNGIVTLEGISSHL